MATRQWELEAHSGEICAAAARGEGAQKIGARFPVSLPCLKNQRGSFIKPLDIGAPRKLMLISPLGTAPKPCGISGNRFRFLGLLLNPVQGPLLSNTNLCVDRRSLCESV